jgi:hypothetical protein
MAGTAMVGAASVKRLFDSSTGCGSVALSRKAGSFVAPRCGPPKRIAGRPDRLGLSNTFPAFAYLPSFASGDDLPAGNSAVVQVKEGFETQISQIESVESVP